MSKSRALIYLFVFCVCAFLSAFNSQSQAATFTTQAQGLGCQEGDSGPVSASASCLIAELGDLTAEAFATAGDGAVTAFASSISQRIEGFGTFTGPASASALALDAITISGAAGGSVIYRLDVQGSTFSSNLSEDGAFTSISTGFSVNGTNYYSGSAGGGTLIDGVFAVVVPIADGILRMRTSAAANARACTIIANDTSCFAEANFGSSLRFLGITVLDAFENDVTDQVSIVSESGFDYVAGAQPHDRPEVVPLPAPALLLLSAFVVLGSRRKGRS